MRCGALLTVGATAIGWAQIEADPPQSARVVANGPMALEEFRGTGAEQSPSDAHQESLSEVNETAGLATPSSLKSDDQIVLAQSSQLMPPPALPPFPDGADASVQDTGNPEADEETTGKLLVTPQISLLPDSTSTGGAKAPAKPEVDPDVLRLPTLGLGTAPPPSTDDVVKSDKSSKQAKLIDELSVAPPPIFALEPLPMGSPLTGPRDDWNDELFREDDNLAQAPAEPDFGKIGPEANKPEEDDAVPEPPQNSEAIVDTTPRREPINDLPDPTDFNMPGLDFNEKPQFNDDASATFSGEWTGNDNFIMPSFNDEMLVQFGNRFARFSGAPPISSSGAFSSRPMAAWWAESIDDRLRPSKPAMPVSVQDLVLRALQYSPDVLAFQLEPEIQRKSICEAQAEFDWAAYAEVTYDDVSDPVGNTLTTGGSGPVPRSQRGDHRRTAT